MLIRDLDLDGGKSRGSRCREALEERYLAKEQADIRRVLKHCGKYAPPHYRP
jgi:hypothetical protein